MPNTRAVVVDLGGVIFVPVAPDPWSSIAAQLGVSAAVARENLWHSADIEAANIGVLSAEAYAERAAARLRRPAPVVLATIEAVFTGAVNEPLVHYLRGVRSTVPVAALTNNWSFLDRLLVRHELRDMFSVIVNSADVGYCKPHPRIFSVLLERLGCKPADVVLIDDEKQNVDVASALGFRTIHYRDPELGLAELQESLEPWPKP